MKELFETSDDKLKAEIQNLENIAETLAAALSANGKEISIKSSGFEKDLDIKTVINNSLLILERELGKSEIQVLLIGESFEVKMAEGALMQVMTNIISNSISALNQSSRENKVIKIILESSQK